MSKCPFESNECPDESQLTGLLMGQLNEADEAFIETQVSRCTICEQNLARLSDSKELQHWQKLLSDDEIVFDRAADQRIRRAIENAVGGTSRFQQKIINDLEAAGYIDIEKIGSGGMGIVVKARQPTLNRVVAIKVLRNYSDESNQYARFLREAEAVAQINQENVLQIIDIGEVNDLPFLVFEYIDGPNLSELAARQPQDPTAAARVVKKIADGVAAAHRLGIVHRDIKPANVLMLAKKDSRQLKQEEVGLDEYVPKVADFGLAKELAQFSSEQADAITRTNQMVGTPSYMAPEQIAGQKGTLGYASDVYSIGVVLYELLSGHLPYTGKTTYQLLKNIETLEPISLRRQNTTLPSDLEAICFKCLQKDPRQRYENAEMVADDLERFLFGNSVVAKPASWLSKTNKWIRRNPIMTMLVATILTCTAVGAIAWANFTTELAGLNSQLENQNADLVQQKRLTDEINSFFLTDVLQQSSSESQLNWLIDNGQGSANYARDPTLKTVLDRAAAKVLADENAFDDEPLIKASLLNTIGKAYRELGRYDEAISYLQKAKQIVPSTAIQLTAETKRQLALAKIAKADTLGAKELLESSQDLFIELGNDFENNVLEIDRELAELNLNLLFDTEAAVDHAESAYLGFVESLGERDPRSLAAAATLARVRMKQDQPKSAIDLMDFVVDATGQELGDQHPATLSAKFTLSQIKRDALDLDGAYKLQEEIWVQAKETLGGKHPVTLFYQVFGSRRRHTDTRNPVDQKLLTQKMNEAVRLLEEAEEGLKKVYHYSHPVHWEVTQQLTAVYPETGNDAKLLSHIQNRLDVLSVEPTLNRNKILAYRVLLGRSYIKIRRFDDAIEELEASVEELRQSPAYGEAHELTLGAMTELGTAWMQKGELNFAADQLEDAYEVTCEALGVDHTRSQETAALLIYCLMRIKAYDRFVPVAKQFLQNLGPGIPKHSRAYLTITDSLAHGLQRLGRFEEAEPIFQEIVGIYQSHFPMSNEHFRALKSHGSVLVSLNQFERAEKTLLQVWTALDESSEKVAPARRNVYLREIAASFQKLYAAMDDSANQQKWTKILNELNQE